MARGIDFRGVSSVINYDFPQTTQEYIHRIGDRSFLPRPTNPHIVHRSYWSRRQVRRINYLLYGRRRGNDSLNCQRDEKLGVLCAGVDS